MQCQFSQCSGFVKQEKLICAISEGSVKVYLRQLKKIAICTRVRKMTLPQDNAALFMQSKLPLYEIAAYCLLSKLQTNLH